jgi:hypothetical protein
MNNPTPQRGADPDNDIRAYQEQGTLKALHLGNRGPIKLDAMGRLDPMILDSYKTHGFYIFEGLLADQELRELEADVEQIQQRAPVSPKAIFDQKGQPALGHNLIAKNFGWVVPLSDPVGGTDKNQGRHPVKMHEPKRPSDAPDHVLQIILGSLQFSQACLRLYGHPQLLAVAEAINGPDFTPFNEAIWIKHPHLGGSVAWHQDGTTQWGRSDFDEGTHGFNFMAQLYGSDAENGLWVVPGSQTGPADIKQMMREAGSDRLTKAVPLICAPGDVAICNRQAVHGSFANTSSKPRVTLNFGFHRRGSVFGAMGNGIHSPATIYDADRIFERAKMIAYGISARSQHLPDEQPYAYAPLKTHTMTWDESVRPSIQDYNLLDLGS